MTANAYPLQWPFGWPRTLIPQRNSKFKSATSVHWALDELETELRRLCAQNIMISSNVSLGQQSPKDKGVCVYFSLKGKEYNAPPKPYALPCDKWDRVEHNLWALAKHIESIRGQERWGVGTIERHFAGYTQLNAPAGAVDPAEWWTILRVLRDAKWQDVESAYKRRALECHPDRPGGNNADMANVNAAFQNAKLAFR